MNKKFFSLLPALMLAGCCFAASTSSSGSAGASSADKVPLEFANTWATGGPYSLENLKGKAVVIYFYVDT